MMLLRMKSKSTETTMKPFKKFSLMEETPTTASDSTMTPQHTDICEICRKTYYEHINQSVYNWCPDRSGEVFTPAPKEDHEAVKVVEPDFEAVADRRGYSNYKSHDHSVARSSFIEGCDFVWDTEVKPITKKLREVEAERDALKAALTPFAKLYHQIPADKTGWIWAYNAVTLKVEDFKQAALLAE